MEFANVYGIHFERRFFDSIYKAGPSGIRTHDLVLTVNTLSFYMFFLQLVIYCSVFRHQALFSCNTSLEEIIYNIYIYIYIYTYINNAY